ncbi:hypothetical protein [Bifidobacterium sp. SO1]|uniref:hypothetical protein n=1 Tax=Bifidobacterium sp. SO1 TaxID=2809029 RepID=UPI001BDC5F8C|nr:hypothetical protein [Bifidobacterium sp. SO1]MBT1162777.1 hypothetical protein [Bifidobacterium sp. SO1]
MGHFPKGNPNGGMYAEPAREPDDRVLHERLDERYPLPKDGTTLVTISQYELEQLRRTAYRNGWKAGLESMR